MTLAEVTYVSDSVLSPNHLEVIRGGGGGGHSPLNWVGGAAGGGGG